jgi:uncharacterized protein (DUF983 family)
MNFLTRLHTVLCLRCPRCQRGKLFVNALTMNVRCPDCGLDLEPEAGFYLGSIYANYALTAIVATTAFVVSVFGAGIDKNLAVGACLVFTTLFPLWFFRYSRSIWLSLMYHVNSSDFATIGHSERQTADGANAR